MRRIQLFVNSCIIIAAAGCGLQENGSNPEVQSQLKASPELELQAGFIVDELAAKADRIVKIIELEEQTVELEQRNPERMMERLDRSVDGVALSIKRFISENFTNRLSQLNGIISELKVSSLEEARKHITSLNDQIAAKNAKIFDLREKLVDLPDDDVTIREVLYPDVQSKEEANRKIAELKQDIEDLEQAREDFVLTAQSEINLALGTEFNDREIRALLLTPEGAKFAESIAIFSNYKPFVKRIKDMIIDGKDELSNAELKRYQGAYLTLIATLRYSQLRYLDANAPQIEKAQRFIPTIEEKIAQDGNTIELIRVDCEERQIGCAQMGEKIAVISSNIQQRLKTIEITEAYISYLEQKAQAIYENYMNLRSTAFAAKSTYTTISDADTIISEIKTGITLFGHVDSLELPEMELLSVNLEAFEQLAHEMK